MKLYHHLELKQIFFMHICIFQTSLLVSAKFFYRNTYVGLKFNYFLILI
jgi:hypothetical protein